MSEKILIKFSEHRKNKIEKWKFLNNIIPEILNKLMIFKSKLMLGLHQTLVHKINYLHRFEELKGNF